MFKLALILLLVTGYQEALIKRSPNGVWFTGKGCGITNEIKYLTEMPKENHQKLSCTFVSKANPPPTETCKDWIDFWFSNLSSFLDTCTQVYTYDIKTNQARKIRQIDSSCLTVSKNARKNRNAKPSPMLPTRHTTYS